MQKTTGDHAEQTAPTGPRTGRRTDRRTGTTPRARTRVRARAAALTAVVAALPLTLPAAPAAAAPAAHATSPVGTWTATVSREGASYDVTLSFSRTFVACLTSPAGSSRGTWQRTAPTAFGYRIRELWFDAAGNSEGWVDIDQRARQSSPAAFTSNGDSTVYLPDGTRSETVPVRITAVRTSSANPPAC